MSVKLSDPERERAESRLERRAASPSSAPTKITTLIAPIAQSATDTEYAVRVWVRG